MMIIEDGTGLPGANSYASEADTIDYHALRLNVEFETALAAAQRAGLVHATDYIEATYRAHKPRKNPAQGLQWPVEGCEAVPPQIVTATMTLALYALNGPLTVPASRGIKSKTLKAEGAGENTTVFDDAAPADPYPHITAMLTGIATLRGGSARPMKIGRLIR